VLSVELTRVEERRADLVLLLANGDILHIEFQSTNDKEMPYREDHVDLGETRVAYTLMDIRDMDARELMASGRPGDLPLAILADSGPDQMLEILKRASELSGAERQRVLSQLVLLSGLRRLTGS
jgi:hypothetical protein